MNFNFLQSENAITDWKAIKEDFNGRQTLLLLTLKSGRKIMVYFGKNSTKKHQTDAKNCYSGNFVEYREDESHSAYAVFSEDTNCQEVHIWVSPEKLQDIRAALEGLGVKFEPNHT